MDEIEIRIKQDGDGLATPPRFHSCINSRKRSRLRASEKIWAAEPALAKWTSLSKSLTQKKQSIAFGS